MDLADCLRKISMRALKLFMLGLFLQGGYFYGVNELRYGVDIQRIRIMGILQRISIAYFIVAVCELTAKKFTKRNLQISSFVPVLYTTYAFHWVAVLMLSSIYVGLLYGLRVPDWEFTVSTSAGFEQILKVDCNVKGDLGPGCNAVGFLDRWIFGINHLHQYPVYRRAKECSINSPDYGSLPANAPTWCLAPFDPEGLLSSLMAVSTCFIGSHYGHVLIQFKNHKRRLFEWIIAGLILNILGLTIAWLGSPLNKPLYSLSYLCVTAGVAGLLFAIIYVLVDIWNCRKIFVLFEWMGMNALLIFVLAACEVFPALIRGFYWTSPDKNMVTFVEIGIFQKLFNSKKVAKMAYVIFEIMFWFLISGLLKTCGIFWKL